MKRDFYLEVARSGLRMPIGTHLVLAEQPDYDRCLTDGAKLGRVVVETARRFQTPLAFPLMDLMVEKQDLLGLLDIPADAMDSYHFHPEIPTETLERVRANLSNSVAPRLNIYAEAIRHVAAQGGVVPMGMAIGPFSLMTKLLADPISALYMAGTGLSAKDDPDVSDVECCLQMGLEVILRSIRMQLEAGAKAICLCEPAANQVYLSPHQLNAGATTFERYVVEPNRRIRQLIADFGADLVFHDCGELTDNMVRTFCTLDPAILSLGSSRALWEDAALVPKNIVLFGNLPTKKFYSDSEMPVQRVKDIARDLSRHMTDTGHPFILGSECDVLSVPGREEAILDKVAAFMHPF